MTVSAGSVAGDVRSAQGRAKKAAGPPQATGARPRRAAVVRAEWNCRACGVHGLAPNEFAEMSPHAGHEHTVVARGTQEKKPKGDHCLKCIMTWGIGGWREEFGDDFDGFCTEKESRVDWFLGLIGIRRGFRRGVRRWILGMIGI